MTRKIFLLIKLLVVMLFFIGLLYLPFYIINHDNIKKHLKTFSYPKKKI